MRVPLLAAFASSLAFAGLSLSAAEYAITDLGPGSAADINASGKIVGNDVTGAFTHDGTNRVGLKIKTVPFGATGVIPVSTYFPTQLTVNAINDNGTMGGRVTFFGDNTSGFVFTPDGFGVGYQVDQTKQIFGLNPQGTGVGGPPAVVFDGNSVVELGGFNAYAINGAGTAVGNTFPGGVETAVIFTNGTQQVINLNPVLPAPVGGEIRRSYARSINEAGQIVGWVKMERAVGTTTDAFIFSGGSVTNLGGLGGTLTGAYDINNQGVVVGQSEVSVGNSHAFIYRNGVMTDLNTLIGGDGWVLVAANAINDAGQIVGYGTLAGETKAFLLSPSSAQPPALVTHPTGGTFMVGDSVTLTATATSSTPLSYQWQRNQANLDGQTNSTLVLSNLQWTNSGAYRVIISNPAGSAISKEALITVLDPLLSAATYIGLTVNGVVGSAYRIDYVNEAGATNWTAAGTLTLTNASQIWFDAGSATNQPRFYRSVRLP